MNDKNLTHWLWFDYETTGLWTAADKPPSIIQMAGVLLPFGSLDVNDALFTFEDTFRLYSHQAENMDPYVLHMHTASGLLDAARASHRRPYETEEWLLEAFEREGIKPKQLAFAGTGIAPFDIPLMRYHMFDLYEFGHYAPYDLGTGRRMIEAIFGTTFSSDMPDSGAGHTALADVYAMLGQARWLRSMFGSRLSPWPEGPSGSNWRNPQPAFTNPAKLKPEDLHGVNIVTTEIEETNATNDTNGGPFFSLSY